MNDRKNQNADLASVGNSLTEPFFAFLFVLNAVFLTVYLSKWCILLVVAWLLLFALSTVTNTIDYVLLLRDDFPEEEDVD